MEKQSTEPSLEEMIKRHVDLISAVLIVLDEKVSQGFNRKEVVNALINVTSSMAYAEGMPFDTIVHEVGMRYSALDEIHEPPQEGDAIH